MLPTFMAAYPCEVELKVVDGHGDSQHFSLTRVELIGTNVDLLQHSALLKFGSGKVYKLTFMEHKYAVRGPIALFLSVNGKKAIKKVVTIGGCPQRLSIVVDPGLLGPEDSVNMILVGKIKGCAITGDWWVRVYPMFGLEVTEASVEGTIKPDGGFVASGFMGGQRGLLIIGRGKQPIKVIGLDVYTGKTNQLGVIDLASSCPT